MEAELAGLLDVVDGFFPTPDGDAHYLLVDYAARWVAGEPQAGDDAADARFHPLSAVPDLGLWSETVRIIDAAARRAGAG